MRRVETFLLLFATMAWAAEGVGNEDAIVPEDAKSVQALTDNAEDHVDVGRRAAFTQVDAEADKKFPEYISDDARLARSGHYDLGPNRRRVGAGMRPLPPPPPSVDRKQGKEVVQKLAGPAKRVGRVKKALDKARKYMKMATTEEPSLPLFDHNRKHRLIAHDSRLE